MGLYNTITVKKPKKNAFGLSLENHLSTDFSKLTPVLVKEVLPGDSFRVHTEAVIKLAPLLSPVMSRIDAYFHYFFVPNRLLYKGWEDFITGGLKGEVPDGTLDSPVAPYVKLETLRQRAYLVNGTLADYMGLPQASPSGDAFTNIPPISVLPFLAYQKIYSDWFRDEFLEADDEFEPVDGGEVSSQDLANIMQIRSRAWKKDYFTSARPETQLGPEQAIPIVGNIVADGPFRFSTKIGNNSNRYVSAIGTLAEASGTDDYLVPLQNLSDINSPGGLGTAMRYGDGLSLDDAEILINDLRRGLAAQRWKETSMRGGNRYIESVFAHFGVRSSDARLQRSQFLGGRKIPIVVGEILQNVDTSQASDVYGTGSAPLGMRGGVANASGRTKNIHLYAEEHGFFICLLSIMPHASYMQGIPRMFANRVSRFDYPWPEFTNIGEQEVFNYELYAGRGSEASGNDGVFGYQSRYAEFKSSFGEIHGDFRDSLRFWHNARIFANRPNLNKSFVHLDGTSADADGQNRIFAVVDNSMVDHFYCHLYHDIKAVRCLSKYGVPGI